MIFGVRNDEVRKNNTFIANAQKRGICRHGKCPVLPIIYLSLFLSDTCGRSADHDLARLRAAAADIDAVRGILDLNTEKIEIFGPGVVVSDN